VTLRLGTRGSALALAQAEWVAARLEGEVEVVPVKVSGKGPDKARFVKEIEEALLEERIDLAVHSAKDVPGVLPDGLAIVGVPEREDPRDALCGAASLDELREGAVVGTASLRRRAQLLAARPDLDVRQLRGNVDTRLGRLADGGFDALVLAAAGLARLDRSDAGDPIPAEVMTPAPGQGCLALEARASDGAARAAADVITDRSALIRLTAERALVAGLDASCDTPIGAHAEVDGDALRLAAFAGLPDGSEWIRDELEGDASQPGAAGRDAAERMLAAGAADLLARAEALAAR
jgi:hydroxymethylbilane synthase